MENRSLSPFKLSLFLMCFLSATGSAKVIGNEISEALVDARGAYLQGRPEDAVSMYRYVLRLSPDKLDATVELALVLKDLGQMKEALPLWVKATVLSPRDPFLWLGRGWCLLSLEKEREAKESFQEALEGSTSPAISSEASLGIGFCELLRSDYRKSVPEFQKVFRQSPYWLPAAGYLLGKISARFKKYHEAIAYLQQSLVRDEMLQEASLEIARVYEKIGETTAAWQHYRNLMESDPGNIFLNKKVSKLSRYLKKDESDLLAIRRIAWPYLKSPYAGPGSEILRVGLFADEGGAQTPILRFKFIASGDFGVGEERLGNVTTGEGGVQWEVRFVPERKTIELRNNLGVLEYATGRPVRIKTFKPGGSILIQSVESGVPAWVDLGDREIRGEIEIVEGSKGAHLVNHVPVELYLWSVVSHALPRNNLFEACKAQAVISRTAALYWKNSLKHKEAFVDVCDSKHCQVYPGMQEEGNIARKAVKATRGEILVSGEGAPLEVDWRFVCGGIVGKSGSPREIEEMIHQFPSPDANCGKSGVVTPVALRWLRILDGELLEKRLRSKAAVGALRTVVPLGRTAEGRILSLRVAGRKGETAFTDFPEISGFISPDSLRSRIISVWPLYKGRSPRFLLVWGVGTGEGKGFCQACALGLANLGRKYPAILKEFYPGAVIKGPAKKASKKKSKK